MIFTIVTCSAILDSWSHCRCSRVLSKYGCESLSSRHMISSTLLVSNNHKPVCVCVIGGIMVQKSFGKSGRTMHACVLYHKTMRVLSIKCHWTIQSSNKICHCTIDS